MSPYRNQTDYICIKDNPNVIIYNSKSHGGMYTGHKHVMTKILFKWKYSNTRKHRSGINY